jgi:hypothetical protein
MAGSCHKYGSVVVLTVIAVGLRLKEIAPYTLTRGSALSLNNQPPEK